MHPAIGPGPAAGGWQVSGDQGRRRAIRWLEVYGGSARADTHASGRRQHSDYARQVGEWAKAQGIEVKDRGRVPAELVARFQGASGTLLSPGQDSSCTCRIASIEGYSAGRVEVKCDDG